MKWEKNILCIGAGYVGGPTMAVIASQCPRYKVTVVDINSEKIRAWNSDHLPIFEPGLEDIVMSQRGKNLFFSDGVYHEIGQADIIFVSVNTPTKTFGEGAGRAADLQYWEKTARDILEYAKKPRVIVIEKSTVPVRTAEAMARILQAGNTETQFDVISNPEFMAEGTAVNDLLNPDRVLIGGHETEDGKAAIQQMVELYKHWVSRKKILTTNVWSSELSKLAANAMLAQRISAINSLTGFCEATGADISEVARAVGMDSRIGPKFLNASIGFGGSCFRKDVLNLVYLLDHDGRHTEARFWEQVIEMNDFQKQRFVSNIVDRMFNTVAGKRIALFGFAFKANTGDTRDTPAIYVARRLHEEKAEVVITDPRALDNAENDLADLEGIQYEVDPYMAAEGSHAIAVLTEWSDFQKLDYKEIFESMVKPAFIFDGRNILDHQELFEIGFNVYPVGKAPLTHL